ncbi:hypothetical protein Q5P01_009436 [Channa striata]|uniref:GIY-YIG domain-containing protein n=1 Tax=Channa striata TaxID=64152 RepID=A0AA88MWX9_CHASR|nr:hypothetical protein Q5P01_009436 [Channa striata]
MPKSVWTPSDDKLPDNIKKLVIRDLEDFRKGFKFYKEQPNLTGEEVIALRELVNNNHIVIKPADKGSAVVIMGRDPYVFEVHRQLNDNTYYKPLTAPIYVQTTPLVHSIIDTLKDKQFITDKQRQYLRGDRDPRERRFYILPKIHKDPAKWTVPHLIPPGRPIVSDCGSEMYQTAEYIDYFLYPLSILHPSYVKDTYHFIDIVKSLQIPQNSFFFSLDVDSLYTNIDIRTGLASVKKVFEEHPDPHRPDGELLQLLEINLTRNDFVFDGKFYLQIKGTAMGKRFAPSYANIFMANWEEEALIKCSKRPLHYLRYLDDIWGVWCHSEEEFEDFMVGLNSHDSSITLKHTIDHQSIDVLDTTVYKGPSFAVSGKLDVKVFFKDTDTHALLFRSSFHPQHMFRGLVKSQLLRFHRICTQTNSFWEAVRLLFGALRKRGYSRSFLRRCLIKFKDEKIRTKRNIIPLITKYSSMSKILNRTLKLNYETFIGKKGILTNCEVISAYTKNKNLRDYLVRAKLKPMHRPNLERKLDSFFPLKFVKNRVNNRIYSIDQQFTPQTRNCVYIIFCIKCGKQYIGETKNTIRMSMWQHRFNIHHKREANTPLVDHFILHGIQALRVAGLQSYSCWTDKQRQSHERQWIHKLQTLEPIGLNIKH